MVILLILLYVGHGSRDKLLGRLKLYILPDFEFIILLSMKFIVINVRVWKKANNHC